MVRKRKFLMYALQTARDDIFARPCNIALSSGGVALPALLALKLVDPLKSSARGEITARDARRDLTAKSSRAVRDEKRIY